MATTRSRRFALACPLKNVPKNEKKSNVQCPKSNVKTAKPHDWKPGAWLNLKLQLTKQNNKSIVQGKIWPRGSDEPKDWTITFEDTETEKPPKGRASVWGIPYSGTPIDFDDIAISK